MVFAFVAEHAPMHRETVHAFFRKRGAYASFKAFLARSQLLDRWHAFEAAATRSALEAWTADNGFVVVDELPTPRASDAS